MQSGGVRPRKDGVLVVIKAKDCPVCQTLEDRGVFREIDRCDLGPKGDICMVDMDAMGPIEDKHGRPIKVFNLVRAFPRFMYMFPETLERAEVSGSDYASVAPDIRFFCCEYNELTQTVVRLRDVPITAKAIQAFCDESMVSLLNGRAPLYKEPIVSRATRKGYY